MAWTARTNSDGLYYGGSAHSYYWDPAVNPNAVPRYCMANCTTYAYGRMLEAGSPAPVSVIRNANYWHTVLTNGWTAIPYDPTLVAPGDILEYATGRSNHVAVVEDVSNGIVTSNSNYTSRDTSLGLQGISNYFNSTSYLRGRFFNISNEYWGGTPTYILKNPDPKGGGGGSAQMSYNKALGMLLAFYNTKGRRSIIHD